MLLSGQSNQVAFAVHKYGQDSFSSFKQFIVKILIIKCLAVVTQATSSLNPILHLDDDKPNIGFHMMMLIYDIVL